MTTSDFVEAFSLGNAAILGNVCVLPLYPGLLVLVANQRSDGSSRPRPWIGVVVLAGIVTVSVLIGLVLYQLQRSAADILGWLLPLMYGAVFALGVAMILGRNPLARIGSTQVPVLRNRVATAYVYGMAMGPLTLPCTGPVIVSAFVVGGVSGSAALVDSLLYFVWFALGFGWPLVALPLLALSNQRAATRFLARHHRVIGIASGALLVVIAVLGYWNDIRPSSSGSSDGTTTSAADGVTADTVPRWTRELEGPVVPGPVIRPDGSILAASNGGVLHALDPVDGHDLWTFDAHGSYGDDLSTSPAVTADGTILWPGPSSTLYALDAHGSLLWQEPFQGLVLTPAVVGDDAYVADRGGHLTAMSLDDGRPRRRWTTDLGGPTYASPKLLADGRVVTSGGQDLVTVIDRGAAGEIGWRYRTGALIEVSASITSSQLITIGSNDGFQHGVRTDGSRAWRTEVGDFIYSSSLVTADGLVLFGDNNGVLFALDATDGHIVRRRAVPPRNGSPDGIWTAPIIDAHGNAAFGTVSGHLYGVGTGGRVVWHVRTGGMVASYPAVTSDGLLVIGSADRRVYAIDTALIAPPG